MKQKTILFISAAIAVVLMTQCRPPDRYPAELDKLVPGASLIFKAKILVLHTVSTDEQDVTNAGVVTVTQVLEAPDSFPDIAGQQVTVRFADISKASVGEERLFFTEPYWIGESIGVMEKGSIMKSDKSYESPEMSSHLKQARMNQDDEELRKTLKEAKLVVVGKVLGISEPAEINLIGTEHAPEWREADVQVDETIKGKAENKTVKILFASGKDVMFFRAPKFKQGDEGIFIIQPAAGEIVKQLRAENILIEPSGFVRGKERAEHIKSLIK